MLARDVMTSPAIAARPETTVIDIVRLMLRHQISAVPIVDDEDHVVGIVSEGDLIRRSRPGQRMDRSWWLAALGGRAEAVQDMTAARNMHASDIMTHDVAMAHADAPLWQIAETLDRTRVKRVPVIEGGRLVGIVSRANLLQALTAQEWAIADHPSEEDRRLRAAVLAAVRAESIIEPVHFNAVVRDATVYYWGDIASEDNRRSVIAAARAVRGVRAVVDHLNVRPPNTEPAT